MMGTDLSGGHLLRGPGSFSRTTPHKAMGTGSVRASWKRPVSLGQIGSPANQWSATPGVVGLRNYLGGVPRGGLGIKKKCFH